jgi:tripartite-type tricarboxylate transporter receptor subunit TctC
MASGQVMYALGTSLRDIDGRKQMRFNFKKAAALTLLGAVFAVVLAACGGEDPTATPTQAAATATPTATLAPGVPTPTPAPATPTPVATPVPSLDAEAYFKGKLMRMLVGYNPGGGTDAVGRYMAANLPKFIPGKPRMIVQNLTPNITQRNFVWHADPDGLTLSTEATSGIVDQLEAAADFDMREVSAIGATSGGDSFWVLWGEANLPYTCADSAIGGVDKIQIADGAASWQDIGSTGFNAGMAARALGIPFELLHVAGGTGSSQQKLMLQRGDVNSWSSATVWSQLPRTNPGWVTDGTVTPFLDMSFTGVTMPDNTEGSFTCNKLEDYVGMTDEVKEFYRYSDLRTSFAKNILGPPNMPPEILEALRKSMDDAMTDAEFVAGLERASSIITRYTPGAEFGAALQSMTQALVDNLVQYDTLREEIYDTYVN